MKLTINSTEDKRLKSLIEDASRLGLWIYQQDYHDESEEYPDHYGMYRLKSDSLDESESIGVEMTLNELDLVLCALIEYKDLCSDIQM